MDISLGEAVEMLLNDDEDLTVALDVMVKEGIVSEEEETSDLMSLSDSDFYELITRHIQHGTVIPRRVILCPSSTMPMWMKKVFCRGSVSDGTETLVDMDTNEAFGCGDS